MTGQELLRVRKAAGISRRELAIRARISPATIQRIEKDLAVPHYSTQHLLLNALLDLPRDIEDELEARPLERSINLDAMEYYLGKADGWRHWTRSRRGQFRRWRLWYQRTLREAQAGRVIVRYRRRPRRTRALMELRAAALRPVAPSSSHPR